jgi:hypothetical protein
VLCLRRCSIPNRDLVVILKQGSRQSGTHPAKPNNRYSLTHLELPAASGVVTLWK